MVASAPLPYDGIDSAWAERQLAAFRALSPSPPPDSFPAFLFGRLLEEDLRKSCRPTLPENVGSLHGVTIQGTCILQIVDVVNIGANFEHRTEDARGQTRTLKLCFTDGHQLVFGFEFQWLPQFSVQTPRGFKVVMQDVNIRHGMLLLTPQNCQLLGASAEMAAQNQKGALQPLGNSQDNSKLSGAYAAALTTAQFGSASGLMATDTNGGDIASSTSTRASRMSTTVTDANSSAATAQGAGGPANANAGQRVVVSGERSAAFAAPLPPKQQATPPNAGVPQRSRDPPPPVFVDVISSDDDCESDKTDPMVEHLFYSPNTPRRPLTAPLAPPPASSTPNARKRPHSAIGGAGAGVEQTTGTHKMARPSPSNSVIVIDDQETKAATSSSSTTAYRSRPPMPVVDPTQPFQYFSSKRSFPHLAALRPPSREQPQMVVVRAFIKSVSGFQFQTGEYQLRVLVEDCSQVRQVDVAPAFVASLMGVSCAEFTRAMQQTPAIAHRWAARMQFALMTLEGVMTFRVDRRSSGADAAEVLTLMNVRDVTRDDASKLLARVAQSVRGGR